MPPLSDAHKAKLAAGRDAARQAKMVRPGTNPPVPESAASTRPSFYNPEPSTQFAAPAMEYTGGKARVEFVKAVQAQAVEMEDHGSADAMLSPEANPSAPDLRSEIDRIRSIRKPLGAYSQKLALPKRSGYYRHWFNDAAGRVDEARENGWSHILDKDKKPKKYPVGSGRDNGVQYAYAMEIPEVFWLEDMEAKHERAANAVASTKKNPFQAKAGSVDKSDAGKFYSPVEGQAPLEITHSVVRN